jgi:hypothetical protein
MKIAIFSSENFEITDGIDQILTKYSEQSPEVLFPVKAGQDNFSQSIIRKCLENRVKVTIYFQNADGVDHLLKQADDFVVCDDPVQEVLRQLSVRDAVGIVWSDSLADHLILHSVEDLALDVWDVTDGLDPIELDDDPFLDMDPDDLHTAMHKAIRVFADMMAAYVANTVMESLGHAIAEHLGDEDGKKDISPFDDME